MKYKTSVKNWEGLAQNDALWSILTDSSKKGEKWNPEEFFASGRKEIDATFSLLEKKGIVINKKSTALDFGCGAGRLTRSLYDRFDKITGVDASSTMVEIASKGNEDLQDKISFLLNEKSDLSLVESSSLSFVISFIVLQHIPFPQSLNFVSEFTRILEEDGLAVFQVPVKDVRKISLWQRIKSTIRIRERLALIGIGSGFQMDMHILSEAQIKKAVENQNGSIEASFYTNQTLPDYNGDLEFYEKETEACGYMSKMFIVRKKG